MSLEKYGNMVESYDFESGQDDQSKLKEKYGAEAEPYSFEDDERYMDTTNLEEIGAAPEMREFSMKALKGSIAASLMGGKEETDSFKEIFPGAEFTQNPDTGEYIVTMPSGGKYVMNKKGFSGQDVAEVATRAGASMLGGPANLAKTGFAKAAQLGKVAMQQMGIESGLQATEEALGGEFDTSNVGFAGVMAPAGEVAGAAIGSSFQKLRGAMQASPDASQKELLDMASKKGVDLLATDVVPPNTFLGKNLQQLNEKLGPLGSGTRRAEQQAQRIEVIKDVAKQFGIDDNSFDLVSESGLIKNLGSGVLKMKEKGAEMRKSAFAALNPEGEVPMSNMEKAIDKAIAREQSKKLKADQSIIKNLEDTKNSIAGDFEHVANIRSTLIDDISAAYKGETKALPSKSIAPLQSVKSAIDKDLKEFASSKNRDAASQWIKSNRIFSEGYGAAKSTAIKKLINSGEESPELVTQILKGQKPSDIKRLKGLLNEEGNLNLKTSIFKKVLDDAGYFKSSSDEISPNAFATAVGKNKKLINSGLNKTEAKELEGLQKLLDSTRRAQDAAVAPPTGVQNVIPSAVGGVAGGGAVAALFADPITAAFTGGTVIGIAKFYESALNRNLLIRLSNAKPGSEAEREIIKKISRAMALSLGATNSKEE